MGLTLSLNHCEREVGLIGENSQGYSGHIIRIGRVSHVEANAHDDGPGSGFDVRGEQNRTGARRGSYEEPTTIRVTRIAGIRYVVDDYRSGKTPAVTTGGRFVVPGGVVDGCGVEIEVILDITVDGREIKALAQVSKQAFTYASTSPCMPGHQKTSRIRVSVR